MEHMLDENKRALIRSLYKLKHHTCVCNSLKQSWDTREYPTCGKWHTSFHLTLLCVIHLCMCLSLLVFFLCFMLSVALNMTFAGRLTKNVCDRFLRKLHPLPFSLSFVSLYACLHCRRCSLESFEDLRDLAD